MTQNEIRWPQSSHAARIQSSPRLQRTLAALELAGDRGLTTRQIQAAADVCAVNSIADELRDNGYTVECKLERVENGSRIYRYTLKGKVAA